MTSQRQGMYLSIFDSLYLNHLIKKAELLVHNNEYVKANISFLSYFVEVKTAFEPI